MKLWRLEAVRGLIALYIVISHVLGNGYFLLRFGQEAVMVFFMMSGFVIEYSFQKSRYKNFGNYFLKRFLRIYPALILMFIVVALIQQPNFQDLKFFKQLLGNLLMLQDFKSGKPNVFVPALFSSALWSLHYQWWHYMLYYPVNQFVLRKKQTVAVGVAGIISTVFYLMQPILIVRLLMYFPIWWVGVEIARSFLKHQYVRIRDIKTSVIFLVVITSFLALNTIIFIAQGHSYQLGIHPLLELRHFTAALIAVMGGLIWQKWNWIGFKYLEFGVVFAPISYSLYIAHQPLLANAHYLGFIPNIWLEKGLYVVILVLFCYVAEIKITTFLRAKLEQPSFRALKAKVLNK